MRKGGVINPGKIGRFRIGILFLIAASLFLGACATPPPKTDVEAYRYYKEVNDPLEPLNRGILKFNTVIEKAIIKPATIIYRTFVPKPLRKGITNFLWNLDTPVVLINDLLQGEGDRAWITTKRFFINSTLGLGGLMDVAKKWGIPRHDEDFGQTLAVHGIREGPYLVLPLFGPSNPRDLFGLIGDIFMDPIYWLLRIKDADALRITKTGVDAVDTYDRHQKDIDNLRETSLDYYAALRSAFRQNRRNEILNGRRPPFDEFEDDIFDDLDDEFMEDGRLNEITLNRLEQRASQRDMELQILYGSYLED